MNPKKAAIATATLMLRRNQCLLFFADTGPSELRIVGRMLLQPALVGADAEAD